MWAKNKSETIIPGRAFVMLEGIFEEKEKKDSKVKEV